MHNLIAFFANVAQNAALSNLTPVTDPLVTVTANNRVIFPEDYQIGAVLANIESGSRCRINTPSFRMVALPEVDPIKITAENGANPPLVGPIWNMLKIPRNDEVGIDVSRAGAGAADCFAALWCAPKFVPAPQGPVFTMRCTSTITLTAGTWVQGLLSFDQVLPYGKYAVVGMKHFSGDAMFARLTFPGQTQYRPGVPATEAITDYVNPPIFRYGGFGLFGTFDSTAQPGIEVLGHTAGSEAGVTLLDIIKVA